uniref:RNase H domain-containing protein n=1 Tax=Rhabditophanes sp. KR3021 TaxID=114890 RepID=A0AC35UCC1_9BILA
MIRHSLLNYEYCEWQDDSSDEEEEIIYVHTGGVCLDDGTEKACAGVGVYWENKDYENIAEPYNGCQTTKAAELAAAIIALERYLENEKEGILVMTNSQYTVDCMIKHIDDWLKNDFVRSDGIKIENEKLIRELYRLTCESGAEFHVTKNGYDEEGGDEEESDNEDIGSGEENDKENDADGDNALGDQGQKVDDGQEHKLVDDQENKDDISVKEDGSTIADKLALEGALKRRLIVFGE